MARPSTEHGLLPVLTPLMLLWELGLVVIVAVIAAQVYIAPDINRQLPGGESEWLTSSGQTAGQVFREQGYIPLWQPYLSFGEPLIDNPFSFVMNPFSSLPSLIYGGNAGIRIAELWAVLIAGLGGWSLGRVLGFRSLGRLLLAALLIGKGNMNAMLAAGYFQLGTSQAYIPWCIAGIIGVLRARRARWPIALTAIAFTLMFWAGNIWYTLPTLLSMALFVPFFIFSVSPHGRRIQIDWMLIRRLVLAALLTLCLSAITLIPIWMHRDLIGKHAPDLTAGTAIDLGQIIGRYVTYNNVFTPATEYLYFSYVITPWFLFLIFVVLPPIGPFRHRPREPRQWSVWLVGGFMLVFCTFWGAGGTALFKWLYANAPMLSEWRFEGRALAMGSFWLAVLVCLRVDNLVRAVGIAGDGRIELRKAGSNWLNRLIIRVPVAILVTTSLLLTNDVLLHGVKREETETLRKTTYVCLDWLRANSSDRMLAVWDIRYSAILAYVRNRVRLTFIGADFQLWGQPSTLYAGNLIDGRGNLPEYGIAVDNNIATFLRDKGYTYVTTSPVDSYGNNCLWQNPKALSYAFSIPLNNLLLTNLNTSRVLPSEITRPITAIEQHYDRIALYAKGDSERAVVVVVQETDYPGWQAYVDDKPAKIESIGGVLGIILPPGDQTHYIYLQYVPPLLIAGGVITLLTCVFLFGFLMHVDRIIIASRILELANRQFQRAANFMTDPAVLDVGRVTHRRRAIRRDTRRRYLYRYTSPKKGKRPHPPADQN